MQYVMFPVVRGLVISGAAVAAGYSATSQEEARASCLAQCPTATGTARALASDAGKVGPDCEAGGDLLDAEVSRVVTVAESEIRSLGVVREDERAERLRQAVCGRLEMDAPGCFEADPTLYAQVCAAVDAAVEATPWVETDPGQYRTRWPRGEEQPLSPAYGHFA